jgi:hypothetical protein
MCDCCQKELRRGAISGHRKTKKHLRNEATYNVAMNLVVLYESTSVKILDTDTDNQVEGELIVYKPFQNNNTV